MIGKQYPSEKRQLIDSKTGNSIWQLTSGDSNNYQFYFTDNSFTVGDREIYFLSDRASRTPELYNLFRMDLSSGIMTQLTDEPAGITPTGHTKTPDSRTAVYVTGNKIKKIDTKTLAASVIYEEKPGIQLGHPHIAPNQKYLGLARNEQINFYRGPNYQGFKEQMFAVKKGWISLVNLDGSQATDVYQDTHWLGHFQFSPIDSHLAMFCHEGPWNLVHQRIWLLNLITRKADPCFRQEEDDSVGHEFWTDDGKIFFDNRRKGHDGTITSDKTQATVGQEEYGQTPYIGLADHSGMVIATIPLPYYCNHYHASRDNTLLVGDQAEDLVLIHLHEQNSQIKTLCVHGTSWHTQQSHCHPTFSWDNQKILYTSDKDGKCNLYLIERQGDSWI